MEKENNTNISFKYELIKRRHLYFRQVPPYLVDSGLHGGLPLSPGHVRQGTRRISRARSHILLLKDEYIVGHRGHKEMSSILAA
jgi:hypothetical protein